MLKWFGILGLVIALAHAGKVVSLPFPTTHDAPQLEVVELLRGLIGSEDLSAWVLEPSRDPIAPAPVPSNSITRAGRSVANRNSNPLNIKLGSATRRYVDIGLATISGIIPKDGGRFLKFESPETGLRAAVELLSTPRYDDLQLDRALRRWSNNGYGAEILAGTPLDAQKSVPYLGRDGLRILLNAMSRAEGYKSSTVADEINKALRP